MNILCYTGVITTDMVGDMPLVGGVWYHSEVIANILSMSLIRKDYQVKYDSRLNNNFRVWNEKKIKYREFRKSKRGLYYTDMRNWVTVLTLTTLN